MTGFRNITASRSGDIIKVKLIDTTYKVYFKSKANINNEKEMEKLKQDLRDKGVPL